MARTGSGKTAAFLVPLLQRLRAHDAGGGIRALVLVPTRELALQTLKFTQEIGRFMDIKCGAIVGGEPMEAQFAVMHGAPDMLVATPGRLLHVCVEMGVRLMAVQMVVFDEGDRLFEMGFADQLREILARLPSNRQTALFSATMPAMLVEFARAGLHDPKLVRLDVDTKLSEHLQLVHISCRREEKDAALLVLLGGRPGAAETVIDCDRQRSIVFVATRYRVEYVCALLRSIGLAVVGVYGALDQSVRKSSIARFRKGDARVLVVTDVAARGLDIPMLENVVNYDFPCKPKLFVHRVGRVARGGNPGTAYSFVAADELPYLLDLHLFLGRPFAVAAGGVSADEPDGTGAAVYGGLPSEAMLRAADECAMYHSADPELRELQRMAQNADQSYFRTREQPCAASVRRAKQLLVAPSCGVHPRFRAAVDRAEQARAAFINGVHAYRPSQTIFEVGRAAHGAGGAAAVMRAKRAHDADRIAAGSRAKTAAIVAADTALEDSATPPPVTDRVGQATVGAGSLCRDRDHYVPRAPANAHSEQGLLVHGGGGGDGGGFASEARALSLDLHGDDGNGRAARGRAGRLQWDRRRKRFVENPALSDPRQRRIRTECGTWIPASYKSDAYQTWRKQHGVADAAPVSGGAEADARFVGAGGVRRFRHTQQRRPVEPADGARPVRRELKSAAELVRARERKQREADRLRARSQTRSRGRPMRGRRPASRGRR